MSYTHTDYGRLFLVLLRQFYGQRFSSIEYSNFLKCKYEGKYADID